MNSFNDRLNRMLQRVSDRRDKRPGAIIYDTLAPVAAELVQQDININIFQIQSYLNTMVGENLDNWAANFMLYRYQATYATRIAEFTDNNGSPFTPNIGARFGTVNIIDNINYKLIERYADGQALLECETSGTIGNDYVGQILPLSIINNLRTANIIGTYRPAQNIETDDAFKQRIIEWLTKKPFGGNVADYKRFVGEIDGVGAVKIFPVWDGGGTVKVSILDGLLHSVSQEFVNVVQEILDPIPYNGEGLGQAPIGHAVTVVTADEIPINIEATIVMRSGFVIGQVEEQIAQSLENYLQTVRSEWATADKLWIFIAQINMAILSVNGVANVHTVTINNIAYDFELAQDKFIQKIPELNEVVLHE